MRKILFSIFSSALVFKPSAALAASVALINPLGQTDVRYILARVISAGLSIIGSLALVMFVYGGLLWMTSRGDPKQVTKGRDTIMWAIFGFIIVFGSYALVNALISGLTTGTV